MRPERPVALFLALGGALALAACGPGGDDDETGCRGDFVAGDLVITEIMANPAGADTGQEWFEIHNASSASAELTGLTLVSRALDGTSEETHAVGVVNLEPGGYLVVGGMLDSVKPPHVDYAYGTDLGDLRNSTGGRLELRCDDVVVDEVSYLEAPPDGVAWGFDGARAPDYLGNDDPAAWCEATIEYAAGAFGSPGAANEACQGVPSGTCDDGGTIRDVVVPQPGDLVITELMPNPAAAADATGEWFEVLATRDVDLNGLQLGKTPGTVTDTVASATCLRVPAGSYVVLARSADPLLNGGLPAPLAVFDMGLTNSASSLFIGAGDQVIDVVAWSTSWDGAATSLDPGKSTATDNDDPLAWCRATTAWGAVTDLGTPGAANPGCPVVVPEGQCLDEGTGTARLVVPPAAGQAVITELMADPAAVGDTAGEWFEVLVTADVDLNGLQLGKTPPTIDHTVTSTACLRVTAGTHVVLARNGDSEVNGGLPVVHYATGMSLTNTASGLFVGYAGAVLDAVTYPTTTSGKSLSLDPDFTNPTDNDLATSWCPALDADVYGLGDKGTPGGANSQCP